MSFLGTEELKTYLRGVVSPLRVDRIISGSYELSVGGQVFLTDAPSGQIEYLTDTKKSIEINPGQFALLITEEEIHLPESNIGFISIKAKIKFNGLVNVSGFHVDPGYRGRLVFSVYNAGPAPVLLEKGQRCFLLWLAKISTTEPYDGGNKDLAEIPLSMIKPLKGNLLNPNALAAEINRQSGKSANQIEQLKASIELKIHRLKQNMKVGKALLFAFLPVVATSLVFTYTHNENFLQGYQLGQKEKIIRDAVATEIKAAKFDSLVDARVKKILEQNGSQNGNSNRR